ncbi:multimeric flavodoxin WrbA [Rhizobium azibense]|uniref:Multimeric flavodoxin WrbA n=1 Tax=Rhizobium azibense TaxID=1136135 RepID=A0A4R3QTS3_9HYPH|nr:flavodoxin family protein [Rhizobium azibense]TCU24569.1 multimeric flavodoxin WrbA [Rhizobium azibense]TCU39317.1 multimeric flavodoxin WrbA [Rhizobium azibense]
MSHEILSSLDALEPRRGSPSPRLDEREFKKRFLNQFRDKAFADLAAEIDKVASAAWQAYLHSRKSPVTRKAGPNFFDPDYELSADWLKARRAVQEAQSRHEDANGPSRVLLINGSSRSEHTCPGELSKSYRMIQLAKQIFQESSDFKVKVLDLSRIASEYGRQIHPCKSCFSTAAPLCHWPCSCYPNYSLGQIHDWMNDIYPLWVEAHGIMIVTPVNWYATSSPLKLMMDRLVCADGGNPDPTSTHGKHAREAKAIEVKGWNYPRHLKDRLFSVVVHGDTEGAENVRRSVSDWLRSMELISAGALAEIDRYIGYWEAYATSHVTFEKDLDMQNEVRNAARTLRQAVIAKRRGNMIEAGRDVEHSRKK